MTRRTIVYALLVPLVWGLQFVVIKVGLTAFPPLFFVGLRFLAIAAILLPFVPRPSRHEIWPMIGIAIFVGGLNFGLTFAALAQGQAGVTSVVVQLSTPFMVLLGWPLLGERPSARTIVGVVLAFAGVAFMVIEPGASAKLWPALLVLGAAFALAVGSVITKRDGPFQPLTLLAWVSLLTVPQVLSVSLFLEHGQLASIHAASLSAWLALAYTVVLVGFGLWFWLIARYSMSRVAPYALLQTVFAVAAGLVFLHEPLTWPLVIGMLMCVGGVAITQIRSRRGHSVSMASP